MYEKIASQQQAQQAWAQTTTENYDKAIRLSLARFPNLQQTSNIDMLQVEETATLASAKSFLTTFHAESESQEYLDGMRAQFGPPSSLTIMDGKVVDCRQIGVLKMQAESTLTA
jgi:hypothetical protein